MGDWCELLGINFLIFFFLWYFINYIQITRTKQKKKKKKRPSPFFPRLLSNAFPDFGSVGRSEKKKKKKLEKESGTRRPGPVSQRNIRGAWKQQDVVIKSTWGQWRKEKSTSWLNSSENSEKRMNHQNCMAKNCLCFGLKWHLFEIMCHCLLHNFFFLKTRKSGSVGRR